MQEKPGPQPEPSDPEGRAPITHDPLALAIATRTPLSYAEVRELLEAARAGTISAQFTLLQLTQDTPESAAVDELIGTAPITAFGRSWGRAVTTGKLLPALPARVHSPGPVRAKRKRERQARKAGRR